MKNFDWLQAFAMEQQEQPEPWVRREQPELQREQRLRRSPQRKRCKQRH